MTDSGTGYSIYGRRIAVNDDRSIVAGISTALAIHVLIIVLAAWGSIAVRLLALLCAIAPGARMCRVDAHHAAVTEAPHPPDEEIIEGALLRQGGGGEYDPRRMIHRVTPILAETRAQQNNGLNKNQNHVPVDASAQHDPTAVVTQREILGRGNQDLAERLARLAAAESENSTNAPPGPGSPDGSVNGTETDPNRAGHGAQAKIRSFLQRQLHLLATAPANAHRTFRLRIVISADGGSVARGQIIAGSGDETTDSDLSVQLAQLAENQTAIPELTDEEKTAIAGHSYTVRYVPE